MIASPVYISGPMTGLPDHNRAAFNATATCLRAAGYEVVNPAEQPEQKNWQEYMRHDLRLLLTCRSLVLLPGYERSRGVRLELAVARALSLPVELAEISCAYEVAI
jgi:hypothetical protein